MMSNNNDDAVSLLLTALRFAADKHRDQRRKDRNASPYINHPIQVADILWKIGGVRDVITLASALLHDTLEDTNATPEEIQTLCGVEVLSVVNEVTDDKTLSKVERKRRQIEHASSLSIRAKQLKLADKICNVYDIAHAPPLNWSRKRRHDYLQWSEQVVAGLRGVNPALEYYYDEILAQARHRLAYEQENVRTFRVGDRVRHPKKPEWGLGQILACTDKHLRVFFVGAGQKLLRQEKTLLARLDPQQAQNRLLDDLKISSEQKVIGYQPLPVLIERFLHQYGEGFYSESYLKTYRQARISAHTAMQNYLNQTTFSQLLREKNYQEICERSVMIIDTAQVLSDIEKISLEEGLQQPAQQRLFAEKLYQFLFAEQAIEARFNAFVAGLMQMNAAHWRIVTSFLFITYPETDILLNPDIIPLAAELCAFNLNYHTQPNWQTYRQLLTFADYLAQSLVDMRPRDLIDVYAFMEANVTLLQPLQK
jgi:GTP diphosphokinase / guanosine-3',5'-bis(diphosphate) 3'-diphosphatase